MEIVVDSEKCTGCKSCELICSLSRSQAFNPRKARIKVFDLDYLGFSNPVLCVHCKRPRCLEVCPTGALSQTDQGIIVIDEAKCHGCRICVDECIIGAMNFDESKSLPFTCDLCGGSPMCVQWCFAGALRLKDAPQRGGNRGLEFTINKSKAFLKKWEIPEKALDWYRKF